MKYAIEMGSGGMIYIPRFIKTSSGVQKLMAVGHTDTQTVWRSRNITDKAITIILYRPEDRTKCPTRKHHVESYHWTEENFYELSTLALDGSLSMLSVSRLYDVGWYDDWWRTERKMEIFRKKENHKKNLTRISGVAAEIRSQHIPNATLQRYR
jgi:hypothetical protein